MFLWSLKFEFPLREVAIPVKRVERRMAGQTVTRESTKKIETTLELKKITNKATQE